MKILALIGSPRKGSNTDILVDRILEGAGTKGHEGQKIYLYDHEIKPCIDCRSCKKGDYICILKDGMSGIYPKLDEADLIIFGTPIYWYGPTGKMKLFIDRMRSYIASEKLKGKNGFVVSPSEEGPKACGPLIDIFSMSFDYLEMEFAGKFLATAYEKSEIRDNPEELDKAYELGALL